MFKDESLDAITIISDVKEEKYIRDQLIQTKPIKSINFSCQVINRNDAEIQTDFEQKLPQVTRMKIDTSKELSHFLLSVYPLISEQLLANSRSHAFDGYEVDWDDSKICDETSCLYTLRNEASPELKVTSICWNSTGSVIAAALGSYDHDTWCVHQSFVYIWNIDRSNINSNKPDKMIDSDTCLMSISFNPKQPALLAGGDFSGKVYIWDMSQEDNPLVTYSGKDVISHQEPVTKLLWTKSQTLRKHEFVSVGCDGRIILWGFNHLKKELIILKKFLLQSENIPRRLRNGMNRNDIKIGITCLSDSVHRKNELYIGTENGAVLKLATDANSFVSSADPDFLSPSCQAYVGHNGVVNVVSVSPFFENIILSCGSDSKVHIYTTQHVKPILVLECGSEYIFSAQWSLSRPTVIFVATGQILVYDLAQSNTSAVTKVTVGDKKKISVRSLVCNSCQHNLVATGDSDGFIKIFSLPHQLTQEKAGELNYFNNIDLADG